MKVYKVMPGVFASDSNCYLVTGDGKSAVAIDPSSDKALREAERLGLTVGAALLTHGHYDHVGGCFALSGMGIPIYCSQAEDALVHGKDSLYTVHCMPAPTFKTESVLKDGDRITLCGVEFSVIATPGHTAGSVTYVAERHMFSGDTLFEESVGRTDLPTGDGAALADSVRKLYALEGDYTVHPGHGYDTTLEHERNYNMYIRA